MTKYDKPELFFPLGLWENKVQCKSSPQENTTRILFFKTHVLVFACLLSKHWVICYIKHISPPYLTCFAHFALQILNVTGGFFCFFFFYVLYSTLIHLPPLRFHCVGGSCMGSNPGLLRLRHWQPDALTTRLKISSTNSAIDLIHRF